LFLIDSFILPGAVQSGKKLYRSLRAAVYASAAQKASVLRNDPVSGKLKIARRACHLAEGAELALLISILNFSSVIF
jgi:hypothetical protein